MRALIWTATLLGALAFADRSPCSAGEPPRVLRYGVADAGAVPQMVRDKIDVALGVVRKRCAHAGFEGVTAARAADGDRIEVTLPAELAPSETSIRALIERHGDVRFRVRASTRMEDEYRDKRLNEGAAPPEGYSWIPDEQSSLQALVETPEAPLAANVSEAVAKLDAAKDADPKDREALDQAAKDALAAFRKACDRSVFSNLDVATATVRRAMSRIGAQSLMHVSVRFELKEDRRAAFEQFTGDHVGRVLCVVVDGKVHVAPVLNSALPGAGDLRAPGTGYTEEQARDLAAILESGPLPLKLVPEQEK